MDSLEFAEWKAYWKINPFGEERADLRQAITTSVIANVNGNNRKVKDYMPDFEKKEQTEEMMKAKLGIL